VCPNGDVLAAWYTTKSESGRELALAASRLPAGSDRWQPASLFFDVPDMNDHAPVLLCDGKRVYHFSNQALRGWVDAAVIMRVSEDSGATWSKPRIILPRGKDPINPYSNNMPVCAFATRAGPLCLVLDGSRRNSVLAVGDEAGKRWRLTKGQIDGIHAATTQLDDGRLVAFGRYPNPMPVSVSTDLGETWQVRKTPFGGISVGQRAAALRLASGALLLCGPDTRKPPWTHKRGTFAALSDDGGKSWAHIRPVSGVGGYLSVAQAPNGVIYLFGTRMGCVAFNEAWVREGKPLPK
jgi:Neuraminidase (sialidase)